mmetsp:Transcript_38520/g.64054  ORF Transcript_38520/g.64054 Transcript_38520/m.64054 type:complete len:231 (+) Transcript_38520:725-1417(+)
MEQQFIRNEAPCWEGEHTEMCCGRQDDIFEVEGLHQLSKALAIDEVHHGGIMVPCPRHKQIVHFAEPPHHSSITDHQLQNLPIAWGHCRQIVYFRHYVWPCFVGVAKLQVVLHDESQLTPLLICCGHGSQMGVGDGCLCFRHVALLVLLPTPLRGAAAQQCAVGEPRHLPLHSLDVTAPHSRDAGVCRSLEELFHARSSSVGAILVDPENRDIQIILDTCSCPVQRLQHQ